LQEDSKNNNNKRQRRKNKLFANNDLFYDVKKGFWRIADAGSGIKCRQSNIESASPITEGNQYF
jgi:hypothetical protein